VGAVRRSTFPSLFRSSPPLFSNYSQDEYRLPEGMRRVGYDADTQVYSYQDTDGSYWEGAPGARYGTLRPGTLFTCNPPPGTT
jgi:hypothetical protein